MQRLWFVMDLPRTCYRQSLLRNQEYMSHETLNRALSLFIKVDMAFTAPGDSVYSGQHPTAPYGANVGSSMRQLLFCERSFTPLWLSLHGWKWDPIRGRSWDKFHDPPALTRLDVLKLWAKHKMPYETQWSHEENPAPIMGMPQKEIMRARFERLPKTTPPTPVQQLVYTRLLGVDEVVFGEMTRRLLVIKPTVPWRLMCQGYFVPKQKSKAMASKQIADGSNEVELGS